MNSMPDFQIISLIYKGLQGRINGFRALKIPAAIHSAWQNTCLQEYRQELKYSMSENRRDVFDCAGKCAFKVA
jgi:hypothetical protein